MQLLIFHCPALIDVPQVVSYLLILPCFFLQLLDRFFYNYSSFKHFSCKSTHPMHRNSLSALQLCE